MKFPSSIKLLIISLVFYCGVFAQIQETNKPLSLTQVEAQIKNVEKSVFRGDQDATTARQIETRGIDFQVTDEILSRLKVLGAGTKTINILKMLQSKNQDIYSNKIRVLIANFGDLENQNDAITETLIEELTEATRSYSNVEIIPLNERISAPQGKETALSKGREQNASIVIWGWFKRSDTNVLINVHFETLSDVPNIPRINDRIQIVEDIPRFDSFAIQLSLSKEMSFLTLASLGLINFALEDFDSAIKCFTEALSRTNQSNDAIALSEIYLYRALARNNKCNPDTKSEVQEDINRALELGLDQNDPRVYFFIPENKRSNDRVALAQKYFDIAKTDGDKTHGLFLLVVNYSLNDDEIKARMYAEKLIDHLRRVRPSASIYIYLAFTNLLLKKYKDAHLALDKAMALAGSSVNILEKIYDLRSTLDLIEGNHERAIENRKKTIEIRPGCYVGYLSLAQGYEKSAQWDLAITNYIKAIELNPHDKFIYLSRADAYERKEEYEKALADYRVAISMDPSYGHSYCRLGYFFESRNEIDAAIANVTKCISLQPDARSYSYVSRARLYAKKKMNQLAMSDYERALRIGFESSIGGRSDIQDLLRFDGPMPSLIFGYADEEEGLSAERRKSLEDLIAKYLDKYIEVYPADGWGYAQRASLFFKRENIKLAIDDVTKAIDSEPSSASFFLQRGKYYSLSGEMEKARIDYEKAIFIGFSDTTENGPEKLREMLNEIRYSLDFSGHSELALKCSNKYIKVYPRDRWGYFYRAEVLNSLDLPPTSKISDRIVADYTQAFQLGVADTTRDGKYFLQEVLHGLSTSSGALYIKYLDRYSQLFPKEGWPFSEKAQYFEERGKVLLSINNMNKAIAMEPENAWYYECRALLWLKINRSEVNYNKSLKDINEAIKRAPNGDGFGLAKYDYYYREAEIFRQKKDIRSAVESLKKAIKILEDLVQKNPYRIYLKTRLKEYEQRKRDLEENGDVTPLI